MSLIKYFLIVIVAANLQNCDQRKFRTLNLSDWTKFIGSSNTLKIGKKSITETGAATSFIRSFRQYENFILEFQLSNEDRNGNRFIITMKGEYLWVVLNNQFILDNALLPGISRRDLQDDHGENNISSLGTFS